MFSFRALGLIYATILGGILKILVVFGKSFKLGIFQLQRDFKGLQEIASDWNVIVRDWKVIQVIEN